jgi:hypothetical protein
MNETYRKYCPGMMSSTRHVSRVRIDRRGRHPHDRQNKWDSGDHNMESSCATDLQQPIFFIRVY